MCPTVRGKQLGVRLQERFHGKKLRERYGALSPMYNVSGGIDTQLSTGFVLSIFGVISCSLLRVLLKISVNIVNDLNPGDIS